ncbi:MAG TPA: ATP-binding cassette domain-containing protein, partial [Paracoccus sp. (in: a-proteobacteria)]|nr:ATP-binding cassette domain-containing protein [Paracoccus sp. (in: a-proteobacteria)]
MIELRGLSVAIHGREVLADVDLTLRPGTVTGLVGESGSGKSMTALAVIGLLPDGAEARGQVLLDGRNLLNMAEPDLCRLRGRRIGMIFQEPMTALNPLMTIGDQVAEVLVRHHRMDRRAALARARERLDRVGLPAPRFPLTLFPHELSGGQRQRVAIAIAIANAPDALIADEPTTALDVTAQAQIMDLLSGLVRDENMALLLITHDLAVVAGVAHRVAVMQQGRIVESGETEALFRTQSHPYTRMLFAAARHQPEHSGARGGDRPILRVLGAMRQYTLPRPKPLAPHPVLRAVDGVSFTVADGESVGLVGESGCGKSTLT